MSVRYFAIASALVVAGSMIAAPAMAQLAGPDDKPSDTVNLSGTVEGVTTVVATATDDAGALNLYGEGTAGTGTVVHVADVSMFTNDSDGVKLTATAEGPLTSTTKESDTLAYHVLLVANGAAKPVAPAVDADIISSTNINVIDFSDGNADRDLYISYDAPALLNPGTYTSKITVTVEAL